MVVAEHVVTADGADKSHANSSNSDVWPGEKLWAEEWRKGNYNWGNTGCRETTWTGQL